MAMRMIAAAAALALMCLGGCVASKVDGNRVNYPNGMSFEVSDAYDPVGKAPYQRRVTSSIDVSAKAVASSVIHVYVKKDTPFKDKTEFVGAYDFMLPQRWFNLRQGMAPDHFFRLDLTTAPAVADLLKDKGVLTTSRFQCGEFYVFNHNSGTQLMSYCAAESVIPPGTNTQAFIRAKFNESVRLMSGEVPPPAQTAQATPALPPAPQKPAPVMTEMPAKGEAQVIDMGGRGKHVVIAYSKVGNTFHIGRSYKSSEDARTNAVVGCEYSDCDKIWVSNENGCVAFAKHSSGGWGKARGLDTEEARAKALKLCNAYSKDDRCTVMVSACPEY